VSQKVGKFCPDFRPHSHYKRSGFKTEQHIENLENAQDAQMSGVNNGQDIFPISPQFLQGVKRQILPNVV